jgi:tRNA (cytidine/uridine-2'-O-)-methyltransferase
MTSIVLVHPEIPHNTGAIGRTCVALDLELVLIKPYGFHLSDRQLKRAGLDYWQHVRLAEFAGWDAFVAARKPRSDQVFLFEEYAPRTFYEPEYPDDAFLVFGSETEGLPRSVTEPLEQRLFRLPMLSDKVRSLNLANTATAAAYQALRGRLG